MSESVCTVSKSCSGGAITALPQLPLENATKEVCVVVVEYGRTDDADERSKEVKAILERANPLNFSKRKKWTITVVACFFTLLAAAATTSYTMGYPSMTQELGCTESQAIIGLSAYVISYAITPLFTSAFSEEFGRQPLYWGSVILAPNINVIAVARVLQGAAGSTGTTMVAGTIADIWETHERGVPMAIYSILAFGGTGIGTITAGWIEANPQLQWKWIQWIFMVVAGVHGVVFAFAMTETRAAIVYARAVKRLSKNDEVPLPKIAVQKQSFQQLLWISGTRPLVLLFSEPIIFAISIWLAFAWGVFYCMIGSMASVFRSIHHFSIGQVGTVNVTLEIAVFIGYLTALLQERMYHKSVKERSVEARLYFCCVAGLVFPASMFMFAWFCQPQIHWALLCFALTIFYWSTFTIYLAVFNYLADCYTTYASSALAGQSLLRNVIGGVFPLFTLKVSDKLGFTWANTIYACIAILLAPIPIASSLTWTTDDIFPWVTHPQAK
ncbi:MFS general substrate transporter [Coprinellus micaceus]|uniref:MFS general substrate transporter n=1 Tax=Coprinellus micaceus TaxID=71717 RepID=A0A4Y7T9C5_COPMI|nr:MFS general substrate transporter [Coprinellus micaceus]